MIVTTQDVFCDLCPDWVHGCVDKSKQHARAQAKKSGWFRVRRRETQQWFDLCPACAKKYHKTKKGPP